jgi:hypothetical protein
MGQLLCTSAEAGLCRRLVMEGDGSEFPIIVYPEWQKEFQAAILELNREKLADRVVTAERAISKRLQALSRSSDSGSERQAIEDALSSLRLLKRNELGFCDGDQK